MGWEGCGIHCAVVGVPNAWLYEYELIPESFGGTFQIGCNFSQQTPLRTS